MKVIRDNEMFGLAMIPLFVDWNIRRCNVEGCKTRPSTIVCVPANESPTGDPFHFGLCEKHYQEGNEPEGTNYSLVFDDFIAQ